MLLTSQFPTPHGIESQDTSSFWLGKGNFVPILSFSKIVFTTNLQKQEHNPTALKTNTPITRHLKKKKKKPQGENATAFCSFLNLNNIT